MTQSEKLQKAIERAVFDKNLPVIKLTMKQERSIRKAMLEAKKRKGKFI